MPEVVMQTCAAAETAAHRGVRHAAGALLVLFALAECGMACAMTVGRHQLPQFLYLACTVLLLAAAGVAVQERRRALVAVRVCGTAAAVMLFWSMSAGTGPDVMFHGRSHNVTPLLAAMLLAVVLLPRLLQYPATDAACNCR